MPKALQAKVPCVNGASLACLALEGGHEHQRNRRVRGCEVRCPQQARHPLSNPPEGPAPLLILRLLVTCMQEGINPCVTETEANSH